MSRLDIFVSLPERFLVRPLVLVPLFAAFVSAACPTWVGHPEPYAIGTIVALDGKNFKVQRTLDNGWIFPTDTWFWSPTTETCGVPAPPPASGGGSGGPNGTASIPLVPVPAPGTATGVDRTAYPGGLPIYASIQGIPGGVSIAGREGTVEVRELTHKIYLPTDPDDGSLTGTRKHQALVIRKLLDKSSPLLFKMLCTGQTIPKIDFTYYEINDRGEEMPFQRITLERVKVADYHMINANILGWAEDVAFRYEKITFAHLDGNIVHTDEWNSR